MYKFRSNEATSLFGGLDIASTAIAEPTFFPFFSRAEVESITTSNEFSFNIAHNTICTFAEPPAVVGPPVVAPPVVAPAVVAPPVVAPPVVAPQQRHTLSGKFFNEKLLESQNTLEINSGWHSKYKTCIPSSITRQTEIAVEGNHAG